MAPKLPEYERRRLENIKRNDEMLAALKIRSRASELSFISKPPRPDTKKVRRRKTVEPTVVRRSLRSHAPPVDESAVCELEKEIRESPKKKKPKSINQPLKERLSRGPVPITMRDAYTGEGSHEKLIDLVKNLTMKCEMRVDHRDGGSTESAAIKKVEVVGLVDDDVKAENVVLGSVAGEQTVAGMDFEEVFSGGSNFGGSTESAAIKKVEVVDLVDDSVKAENVVLGSVAGEQIVVEMDFEDEFSGGSNFGDWDLRPQNISRVGSAKITSLQFFPSAYRTLVAIGNVSGDVGIWDAGVAGDEEDSNGSYMYEPHSAQVSSIVIEPFSMSKIFTSSHDGYIRLMDMEKELFDLVHLADYAVYTMSARPQDSNSLYFSEASGEFDIWDLRTGKSPATWNLHGCRINSIEFNSQNTNIMATSSSDGSAAIWDLRYMGADRPEPLNIIEHGRSVYSACFSPSGSFIATSSVDTVGISSGANFEDVSMIEHENNASSRFRGIWGWDDSHIFIGNLEKRIEVISVAGKETVATFRNENMTGIPIILDAHRHREGMLAGAGTSGQVRVWTSS